MGQIAPQPIESGLEPDWFEQLSVEQQELDVATVHSYPLSRLWAGYRILAGVARAPLDKKQAVAIKRVKYCRVAKTNMPVR